jgi:putative addiction module killer protein
MEVRYFADDKGKTPVTDWLDSISDKRTKTRILTNIDRLRHGNFGDSKPVGDGISELRLHFGAGYRVYYSRQGDAIILLLCAGDKATQERDITNAKAYFEVFKQRLKKENEKKRT